VTDRPGGAEAALGHHEARGTSAQEEGPTGPVVHDLAELLDALGLADRGELEEAVDARAELDAWIAWDDVDDLAGMTVVVDWRGTTLEYPFELHELWAVIDELDDEVAQELEAQARRELEDEEEDAGPRPPAAELGQSRELEESP